MEISSWRVRVDRALRRARALQADADAALAAGEGGFEDRLVGHFGWTRSVAIDDIQRWLAVLASHKDALRRLETPDERGAMPAPAGPDAAFDRLSDDWHAACHAVQSGVRVVALVRHWLPIWRECRADMCSRFGEYQGVPYAAVVARRLLARCESPPFALLALPAWQGGDDSLPTRLSHKLDAIEASLDHAGRVFQAAGCALDAIRRRQDPWRQRQYLDEMTALTARHPAPAPTDRRP